MRALAPGGSYTLDSSTTSTFATSTGLADGTVYYYRVVATNAVGEGGSANASAITAPSAPSYLENPAIYTRDSLITSNTPTSLGAESYSVFPALPAGLSLAPLTGVISGTPSVVTGMADYFVTATNSGGGTTASLSITVNDVPPSALSYLPATLSCTQGQACSLGAPTSSGGPVILYAVNPALPGGLSLSSTTGTISGVPAAASSASYTVTATNSGGSTDAVVTVTIVPPAPAITSPASGFDTTSASQTFSGTGVASSTIALVDSGTGSLTVGAITVDTSGSWSASATLGYGTHSLTATQTSNGQTSAVSNTVTGTVRLAAPTIAAPADNATVSGTNVAVSGLAAANASITLFDSGASVGGTTADASGGFSTSIPLAFGSHSLTATQTVSSQTSAASAAVSITVTDVPPSNLTYPSSTLTCLVDTACSLAAPSSGGGAVVSYGVTPALPAGLALSSTGAISGVPSAPSGATPYTVTATNSGGSTSAFVTITVTAAAPPPPAPVVVTRMTTSRVYQTAVPLQSGKVLMVGGYGPGGQQASSELYDPSSGTWTPAGSIPHPLVYNSATLLNDGRVLIAGGFIAWPSEYGDSWLFSETSGWTQGPDLALGGRAFHMAVVLPSGKVLIVDGAGPGQWCQYRNDAELFDPTANGGAGSWTRTGSPHLDRVDAGLALLANGQVLMAGGPQDNCPTPQYGYPEAELYDPLTGAWTVTGSMSTSRYTFNLVALPDGTALAQGGRAGSTTYLGSAELFQPSSGTFTPTAPIPTGRNYNTATLLPNGKVAVVGGYDDITMLTTVELYDPVLGTWSQGPHQLTIPRALHTATLLQSGNLLVAGGYGAGWGQLDSAEELDVGAGAPGAPARVSFTTQPPGSVDAGAGFDVAVSVKDGFGRTVASSSAVVTLSSSPAGLGGTTTVTAVAGVATFSGLTLPAGTYTLGAASDGLTGATSNSVAVIGAAAQLAFTRQPPGAVNPGAGFGAAVTVQDGFGRTVTSSSAVITLAPSWDSLGGTTTVAAVAGVATFSGLTLQTLGSYTLTATSGGLADAISRAFNVSLYVPPTHMATARAHQTPVLLQSGKVLMVGGDGPGGQLATSELFDPATGTWSDAGSVSHPLVYNSATLLNDGRVLVAGGFINWPNEYGDSWLFSEGSGWTQGPNLALGGRAFHMAVLLQTGKVLIVDGAGPGQWCQYRNDAELFDPTANGGAGSWTRTGSPHLDRTNAGLVLLANGQVLMAGGPQDNCPTPQYGYPEAELYDPLTGAWTVTGSMSTSRYNFDLVGLLDGTALAVGGWNGPAFLGTAELYHSSTGTFSPAASIPTKRLSDTATVLPSGRVAFIGGWDGSKPVTTVEIYDPVLGTWSQGANQLAIARQVHTATLLQNGRILVTGGYGAGGILLDSAEELDEGP